MLFLLVALQTLNVPTDFDLGKLKTPDAAKCGEAEGGDILVCAPEESPRLEPLDENAYPDPNRADFSLGGTWRGRVHIEQKALGGAVSNRLMFSITTPF